MLTKAQKLADYVGVVATYGLDERRRTYVIYTTPTSFSTLVIGILTNYAPPLISISTLLLSLRICFTASKLPVDAALKRAETMESSYRSRTRENVYRGRRRELEKTGLAGKWGEGNRDEEAALGFQVNFPTRSPTFHNRQKKIHRHSQVSPS